MRLIKKDVANSFLMAKFLFNKILRESDAQNRLRINYFKAVEKDFRASWLESTYINVEVKT